MIEFEHTILLEGYYDEHDNIEEALFKEFGYAQGECDLADRTWYSSTVDGARKHNPEDADMYVDYPRCADIDIDGYTEFLEYCKLHELKMYSEDLTGRYGGAGFVLDHSHKGDWYAGNGWKTGYDYMVYSYHFKYREDLTLFLIKHDNLCKVHTKDQDKKSFKERMQRLMKGNAMT